MKPKATARTHAPEATPTVIQLEVQADFVPEDGDAFDAVVEALEFAEIPAILRLLPEGRFGRVREPLAAISTLHLSAATMRRLDVDGEGYEGLASYPNEFGAFVVVDHFAGTQEGPWPASWPADLVNLMDMARKEGLQWLKLDAHAPRIDGVPQYPREEEAEPGTGPSPNARPRSRP